MPTKQSEMVHVKRLKKDGSVSADVFERIVRYLQDNKTVFLPVDNIYTFISISRKGMIKLQESVDAYEKRITRLLSSYKMINGLVCYGKADYDFMNRIWPGEVSVLLKSRDNGGNSTFMRFPKSRFIHDIIEAVESPVESMIPIVKGKVLFRKKDLIAHYRDTADLFVVIDELCKRHPLPTVVDICDGVLRIAEEGKVASEEIKSLYFLGRADEP